MNSRSAFDHKIKKVNSIIKKSNFNMNFVNQFSDITGWNQFANPNIERHSIIDDGRHETAIRLTGMLTVYT